MTLWYIRPIETVEQVLGKVNFPQQTLVDLASSWVAGYYPETFLVLLSKIVKPEDQEKAVEKAIERLVRNDKKTCSSVKCLERKNISK